jgi:hypothetical protein
LFRTQATSPPATDFFNVGTVPGQRSYGLFVADMRSRAAHLVRTVTNPGRDKWLYATNWGEWARIVVAG